MGKDDAAAERYREGLTTAEEERRRWAMEMVVELHRDLPTTAADALHEAQLVAAWVQTGSAMSLPTP